MLAVIKDDQQIRRPFVVAMYAGEGKPSVHDFLQDFMDEINPLYLSGFQNGKNAYKFCIYAFVFDAVARAWLKQIKPHNGYSSCEKCEEEGEILDRQVTFPGTNAYLRTNECFWSRRDEKHHIPNEVSPPEQLPIEMITHFPLDPMHLLYLGVKRRLITSWTLGSLRV